MRLNREDKLKFSWSDLVSIVALAASGVALYQSKEANSPRMVVTLTAERSYVTCNKSLGEWQTKSILRFNLTNVGGRGTTLERVAASSSGSPIELRTENAVRPGNPQSLVRLDKLMTLPDGSAAPTRDLNAMFDQAKPLLIEGDSQDRKGQPLLNIAVEPGKAVTLDIGLTTPYSDERGRVESATVTLQATFAHGNAISLREIVTMARPVIRGGRCLKETS